MTRGSKATLVLAAFAGLAATAHAGDNDPIFRVSTDDGFAGNVMLEKVELPNGTVYDKFIHAASIDSFEYSGSPGELRVIAGPTTTDTTGCFRLEDLDGDGSSISDDDLKAFNQHALEAFQTTNLNNYVDINTSGNSFSCVVTFDREVKDNDPGADDTPEFLYFERGSGGSNSWLVIEALDADGNVIGTPVVMSPNDAVHATPPADVALYSSSMTFRSGRSQEMSATPVDLSALGVTTLTRIRMRNPTGDDMYNGSAWSGGETAPDFKLIVVQTYDVTLPAWVIGD